MSWLEIKSMFDVIGDIVAVIIFIIVVIIGIIYIMKGEE